MREKIRLLQGARLPSTLAQSKERKGSNFAHLATLHTVAIFPKVVSHLLLIDGGLHLGVEDARGRLEEVRHGGLAGTVVRGRSHAALPEQDLEGI